MGDLVISVIQAAHVKGKPQNWMPAAEKLLSVGVPLRIARRWKRERREITVGLRRRVGESRN